MNIIVSACLLGINCKYNGKNNCNKMLGSIICGHTVIPVCPEVLGGLPVPRKPGEIKNGRVTAEDGTSLDDEYRKGAAIALEAALSNRADLAILQSRSPSCGVGQIYDGSFTKTLIPGDGIFAALLKEKGIPAYDANDIESIISVIENGSL